MAPTAKSLVLDLLSTQRNASMPVRALVEAAALFGVAANATRVALARLVESGRVQRDARGCYRLGPAAAAVQSRVRSWRRLDERVGPWNGDWVAVHRTRPLGAGRAARRRSQRALTLLGFRPLAPGLEIRPDNLTGGIPGLRQQLHDLGVGAGALVCGLSDLDPVTARRACRLWDARELGAAYAASQRALAESTARLARLAAEDAMVETFLVGGRVLRQLVLDPLLPEAIVPTAPRQALLADMRAYDLLGRACWAGFLARFGVPHLQNPVDLRVADAAGPGFPRPAHTETGT